MCILMGICRIVFYLLLLLNRKQKCILAISEVACHC